MPFLKKMDKNRLLTSLHALCAHPAFVEIDLGQFRKNIAAIRRKIGKRKFCFPVKCNAYGHGMIQMGQTAQEEGVDCLGVACLKEAVDLRLNGVVLPIFVFGAIHEDQISDLIDFELEFSISSKFKARLVAKECHRLQKRCRVHLEVDTGIQRTGVRPETALELVDFLKSESCFDLVGIYSHFAHSEKKENPFTLRQIDLFQKLAHTVNDSSLLWHIANSGGVAYYPDSYFDMVRPGLLCYGYYPGGGKDPEGEILPCLSLKARVSYFKVVDSDVGISYGHLYRTAKKTRMITVPIGYGDGYRRVLTNRSFVLIGGKRFQVSGAICMDQFMVDVGDAEVFVGDEVILIGKQGKEEISLGEIAQLSDSIENEILCGLSQRLPRIYQEAT